jgi:hypothetical protein
LSAITLVSISGSALATGENPWRQQQEFDEANAREEANQKAIAANAPAARALFYKEQEAMRRQIADAQVRNQWQAEQVKIVASQSPTPTGANPSVGRQTWEFRQPDGSVVQGSRTIDVGPHGALANTNIRVTPGSGSATVTHTVAFSNGAPVISRTTKTVVPRR